MLIKLLLSLGIFLLYGQSFLYAYTNHNFYSSIEILVNSACITPGVSEINPILVKMPSSSGTNGDNLKVNALVVEVEEEDEISNSSKKFRGNVSYSTFFYASLTPGYLPQNEIKKGFFLSKHSYPCSPDKRYLLLEVFRL